MTDSNIVPRKDRTAIMTTKVAPSWLAEVAQNDDSIAALAEYRILPRASIIQKVTAKEKKGTMADGTTFITPGGTIVALPEEPFLIVPVFQFTEFIKWRDQDDKSGDALLEKTFNKNSELAKRARDKALRIEEYGDNRPGKGRFKYSYLEHLNFAVIMYQQDHPLSGQAFAISFKKGEFFQGTNFCNALSQRKVNGIPVPYWTQVWEFRTGVHERRGYDWYGFNFNNPVDESPYILEEEMPFFREQYQELKKLHEQNLLGVDLSDESTEEAQVVDTGDM